MYSAIIDACNGVTDDASVAARNESLNLDDDLDISLEDLDD